MSQVPTPEKRQRALQARSAAEAKYKEISAKLGTDEWNEETDGPALDTAKRSYDEAATLVDRLSDDLEISVRSAQGGGGRGDAEVVPGITANIIDANRRGDKPSQARREFRLLSALDAIVNERALSGLEAEMHAEGAKEARELNLKDIQGQIQLPSWLIGSGQSSIAEQQAMARYAHHRGIAQRDILAETPSAGGYLVATDLGGLIPVLEPRLQVERLGATMLRNLSSNLDLARAITYGSATWEGETDDAAETQSTFDKVSLAPERLAAYTQVSRQSIIQAKVVDVENFTRRDLTRAVRRGLDTASINGSGLNDQPTGILNTNGVNDITIGTDGGPLDWALVVQFETETATDDADFGKLAYLTTPGVAGQLKTTKRDVAGNGYIWEGPNQGGGLVNGYPALTTTLMPSNLSKGSGSNLHAMIFANWMELIIAQWGGIDLIVDPYTNAKKGMVDLHVNTYWDIALMHLASFCICNEIDIS